MRCRRFGYGSHPFLYDYIRKNGCKKIMEIGIADGENARNMILAAGENSSILEIEYYGFDTFKWNNDFKRVKQKIEKTNCQFQIFKGDSVKILPKIMQQLPLMDLIFIDGGHSYSTVLSDWNNSKKLMYNETAIFFHNYDFTGPTKVVDHIPQEEYRVKIIDPPSDAMTALVKKKSMNNNNSRKKTS